MRILLVEDDQKIASFVLEGLKESGYAVDYAADGEDGLHLALTEPYDAAIIDIMLPKLDGLTLIETLRQQRINTPVIILSAKRTVDLSLVAREACDLFQAIAEDKGIAMTRLALDACLVWGDLQRLQRMVANLLDNALKYTPLRGGLKFLSGKTKARFPFQSQIRESGYRGPIYPTSLTVFTAAIPADPNRAQVWA